MLVAAAVSIPVTLKGKPHVDTRHQLLRHGWTLLWIVVFRWSLRQLDAENEKRVETLEEDLSKADLCSRLTIELNELDSAVRTG